MNKISERHPKIVMNFPFRTAIRGQIRTVKKEPIWDKQYPYFPFWSC